MELKEIGESELLGFHGIRQYLHDSFEDNFIKGEPCIEDLFYQLKVIILFGVVRDF